MNFQEGPPIRFSGVSRSPLEQAMDAVTQALKARLDGEPPSRHIEAVFSIAPASVTISLRALTPLGMTTLASLTEG